MWPSGPDWVRRDCRPGVGERGDVGRERRVLTGHSTWEVDSGGGSTQHYDTFLKPDGSQFAYIQTDSGVVSAGMVFRTVNLSKEH